MRGSCLTCWEEEGWGEEGRTDIFWGEVDRFTVDAGFGKNLTRVGWWRENEGAREQNEMGDHSSGLGGKDEKYEATYHSS